MRHRLDAEFQQLDHNQPADGACAHRRVRGYRVGGGQRAQLRVFPVAARRPANRLHRDRRTVRVPGRVAAQLLADGRRRHGGHGRVVRARQEFRAREPGVAGVPRPHRRRRVLQTQAEAPAAR